MTTYYKCPTCGERRFADLVAVDAHHGDAHGESILQLLERMHYGERLSVNKMSQRLHASRVQITRLAEFYGVALRGQSDANRLKWELMSEAERAHQVAGAHAVASETMRRTWRRRRSEMLEATRKANRRSVEVIKAGGRVNGMAGRVGPLHPNWRGGKDAYHRLRSLADGNWWAERLAALRRDGCCQSCGRADGILDVHHIVGLRDGGSNRAENLMVLCRSCHVSLEKGQ